MSQANTMRCKAWLDPASRGLAVLAISVAAAWAQAAPVIYEQDLLLDPQNPATGAFVDQNSPIGSTLVYDNFTLGIDSTVTDVHWTGAWLNPNVEGTITSWSIQFWNDNAGQPGTLALNTTFTPANANSTFLQDFGTLKLFTYSVDLTTTFAATGGTKYWLSVQPTLPLDSPNWGWMVSTGLPGPGDGIAYVDFLTVGRFQLQEDFTFELTGNPSGQPVPEPATLALLGLGLAGMGLARRRKQS